ncbi:signal peptidase II, partial [Clostridium sporogenes]
MGIIILILGIVLDRISKIWALNTLASGKDIVIIKNLFSLSYLENRGAAFGIFQNRLIFLSLITVIVILGVAYFIVKYKPTSKLLKISLSLIISGAIGNLIDRIYYKFV